MKNTLARWLPLLSLSTLVVCQGCLGEIGFGIDEDPPTPDLMQRADMVGVDDMVDEEEMVIPTEPDMGPISVTPEMCADGMDLAAGEAPMRLLTRYEYRNTVRDLLSIKVDPTKDFPTENLANGFENNAYVHVVNDLLVESYLAQAEGLAELVAQSGFANILPCSPDDLGKVECGELFAETFVERAFRRPLSPREIQTFKRVFHLGFDEDGFDLGVQAVIATTLQSPQFLYRIEYDDNTAPGTLRPVSSYEMATRLSYFLWSSMPDEELLAAARDDALSTREEIEAQARRMLALPQGERAIREFYRQWLHLDVLDHITKDVPTYPEVYDALKGEWKESALAFFVDLYLSEMTLSDMLLSNTMFQTPDMSDIYGGEHPTGEGFAPVEMQADRSAGMLTHPALMAILANQDQSSPILRGIFVREKLLCDPIEPPPADIAIVPPDPDPNATTRERFKEHTENEFCQGCHIEIDPIGFGFENFDGVGKYRVMENELMVDASGELARTEDPSIEGTFVGAIELAEKLAQSSQVANCVSDTWFRYSLGRSFGDPDACSAYNVQTAFAESGGDLRELLIAVTVSDAFMHRASQAPLETDDSMMEAP